MKNFIRACLIAILVFVVAGIVLLIVAAAGGVTRASLRLFSDQGRLRYGPVNIRLNDGFSVNIGDGDNSFTGPGYVVGDDGTEMVYMHGTYQMPKTDIKELHLDAAAGEFDILPSEDEYFYVECDNGDFEVSNDDGKLVVKRLEEKGFGINLMDHATAVVYVPDNFCIEELTIDVAAGDMEIDTPLYVNTISIEIGAGNVTINNPIETDTLVIEVGAGNIDGYDCITTNRHMELNVSAGNIYLDDIECKGTLYAECNLGNLEAEGRAYGDITAEVDMGNLVLDLEGNGQAYNYELEADLGELSVNDFDYSGIGNKIKIEGDQNAPLVKLSVGMGDLEFDLE